MHLACFVMVMLSGINVASSVRLALTPPVSQGKPMNRLAFWEASRVYGKFGCGDAELAEMTARTAEKVGVSAALLAAKVATESSCRTLAVSKAGAIGLSQVMPSVWSCSTPRSVKEPCWDFSRVNLLNGSENLEVGATILAFYIHEYGTEEGLRRYRGIGPSAAGYARLVQERAAKCESVSCRTTTATGILLAPTKKTCSICGLKLKAKEEK